MATIPEQTSKIKCFACGSHANIEDFGRLGEIVKTVDNLHQKRQRILARKQEILAQYSMEAMI